MSRLHPFIPEYILVLCSLVQAARGVAIYSWNHSSGLERELAHFLGISINIRLASVVPIGCSYGRLRWKISLSVASCVVIAVQPIHGTTGPEVSSEGQCQGKLIHLLHIGLLLIQQIVNKCALFILFPLHT